MAQQSVALKGEFYVRTLSCYTNTYFKFYQIIFDIQNKAY